MNRMKPGEIWLATIHGKERNVIVLRTDPLTVWPARWMLGCFQYGDNEPPMRLDPDALLAWIDTLDGPAFTEVLDDEARLTAKRQADT